MSGFGLWALGVSGAFLSGSIPFGLLIGFSRGVDVREHGSKNIGATNVMRVLGRKAGYLCFALDVLKGALPVAGYGWMSGFAGRSATSAVEAGMWMAVVCAAAFGHMFTPWARFKGGKGVATGLGAALGVWPALTLPALGVLLLWVVVVRVTRYVSAASVTAAATLPALVLGLAALGATVELEGVWERVGAVWVYALFAGLLGGLVIWRHRGNIARLRAGTERRIGERVGGLEGR